MLLMAGKLIFFLILITAVFLFLPFFVLATEFTSNSFKVQDPVFQIGGQKSTSTSFQLFGSIGQVSIGTSTSSTFKDFGGFLYFPFVTTPVVSATAGDAQVALSWTAATAGLGWSIGSYSVGQSTTAGGPYTNTNIGSGLSSTRTGLTNGTTYYFIIRALDAFSNSIATSTEASATPAAAAPTPAPAPAPSGGGGGGGAIITAPIQVLFTGRAYPGSAVYLLKDAQIAVQTVADPAANFSAGLSGISAGNYAFSVYAEDNNGRRSSLLAFPITITVGAQTTIGGIFLSPTIDVDKTEVRRGDNIGIFGQSVSSSEIIIAVNSDEQFFARTKTGKDGVYFYNFDTTPLDLGNHLTKSKSASLEGSISNFSRAINFTVGTANVAKAPAKKRVIKGDVNGDGRINLVDLSMAVYWYNRPQPPAKMDINGDGKVDLVDISVMVYYWSG